MLTNLFTRRIGIYSRKTNKLLPKFVEKILSDGFYCNLNPLPFCIVFQGVSYKKDKKDAEVR